MDSRQFQARVVAHLCWLNMVSQVTDDGRWIAVQLDSDVPGRRYETHWLRVTTPRREQVETLVGYAVLFAVGVVMGLLI